MADSRSRLKGAAFTESLVHAKTTDYPYRKGLGMLPSMEYVTFFDDFLGTAASNVPLGWSAAIIDTGATATILATATDNGVLRITSDAASEGAAIYLPFRVQLASTPFFMEVRLRVDDADDIAVQFGLTDLTATTNPEDLYTTASADFIAFGTLDGDATPKLVYDKDNGGPVTVTPPGTSFDLADNTWAVLAIAYDGAATPNDGSLRAYVNGKLAATATTEAQVPEDLVLAPFIAMVGGNGSIGIGDFDYVRLAFKR